MACPYTSPQNGKAEHIIRSINNIIRTLLIQASLPRRYWAEGFHTATYLLNRLSTTAIQAMCRHLAVFGSAPSNEHLRIFGCACYPNTAATAPHKLSPRSTRCVFLGYSVDHKGYRYLDLLTNHLIVFRHVVFDEVSIPLAASPNPTNLSFLFGSGSTASTIGTRLTTVGTSTPTPCRTTPKIHLGFESLVALLLAPAVPPGFLPRVATTAAPRVAPTAVATHGSSYIDRGHRRPATPYVAGITSCLRLAPSTANACEYHPPPPLRHPPVGGQGVVVPVKPPENPHRMITRDKTGFRVMPDRLILTTTTSSPTPSPIPTSARATLTDPNWHAAMEDEYGALMSNEAKELVPRP
jgi:hypothetical protein